MDEEQHRILKARALALAQEPDQEDADVEYMDITTFLLSSELYGIENRYIREVYALKDFTPLPCTPSFVFGIINIRGRIVSVIDIKRFFDLPERGLSDQNKVIVLSSSTMEFGILADEIKGVRNVLSKDVQAGLPTLAGIRLEYLLGVTEDRLVVLDGGKLLTDKNLLAHEEVL
jgi:purine-binding chemotaxis protein CheW